MAINIHHTIEEINGVRCSVVEKKISPERANFLKGILESNKLEVQLVTDENGAITLGVSNISFNPIHAIYGRMLKTPQGKVITPSVWYQKRQIDQFYWEYK